MENLVRPNGFADPAFWRGRRVLLTGHTGFIGGWTAAWLNRMGADVTGFALAPATTPSFHDLTGLADRVDGIIADVRDADALARAFASSRPDIVLHLAAQPLVRRGYVQPVETFAINVMGTVNLLDCVRHHRAEAAVVMTSDKVYGDRGRQAWHQEGDALGAPDPYGGSKVCCEAVVEAYAQSYFAPAGIGVATVRAGNVIGGGDWGADRLVPDAVRAFSAGAPLVLRRPEAVRPWQHVLDAVNGLLLVAELAARERKPVGPWNIGPAERTSVTVGDLAARFARAWSDGARVVHEPRTDFPETRYLGLDAARAHGELGFRSPWSLEEVVDKTVQWYRDAGNAGAWDLTVNQIDVYAAARVARDAVLTR